MSRFPVAGLLLALCALNAHAETFTVTRSDDPAPNGCAPNDCSLREAVQAALSASPGVAHLVQLSGGAYTVTRGTLPAIHRPLRIEGVGMTIIDLDSDDETLLEVIGPNGHLTIAHLGLNSTDDSNFHYILTAGEGAQLSMREVYVGSGIRAAPGSLVDIRDSDLPRRFRSSGTLLIEDSAFFLLEQLPAPAGPAPTAVLRRVHVDGDLNPGLYPRGVHVDQGEVTIEASTLSDTYVRLEGDQPVRLTARDTTFTGAGRFIVSSALAQVELHRIRYIDHDGPIRTEAAATIVIKDSLFQGNPRRALEAIDGAQWHISGSSFVNNSTPSSAGGAIVLEDDTLMRIENSTFSGNTFTVEAAAAGARGAAIGFRNATGAQLILRHVTIVPPTFMPAGIVGTAIGGHGHGVTLDIANSIVRGSCGMNSSVLGNNIGNIESPGDTCGLDTQENRVNASAAQLVLGTLGGHGGPTPTYLPGAGSLAIDRASTPHCLPADQRGYRRPGGVRCDVGAVEADTPDLFADGFE